MNFIDDVTETVEYEWINRPIRDGNFKSFFFIITKGNYGAIDGDDSACHGYYIIRFYSSPYTLQSDLNKDGQVVYSGEMVCEGNYYFPTNINYHYYFLQKPNQITRLYLWGKLPMETLTWKVMIIMMLFHPIK